MAVKGGNKLSDRRNEPLKACSDFEGVLPACAPLANPYVPFQQGNSARYMPDKAIIRGTLFPGLDLPFMGMENKTELSESAQTQVQKLQFAVNELVLYLDTHPGDMEATELLRQYLKQWHNANEMLCKKKGPRFVADVAKDGLYDWTMGPWPWEPAANEED